MESPPPYYSGPKKKSNVGLIIGIILGVVCVCCVLPIAGLAGLGFWGLGKMKGFMGCTFAFSNLQHAMQDYADAHDGKLPKAETWQTDIRPYFDREVARHAKEQQMFTSGQANNMGCTNGDSPSTGIAFNSDLSGKKMGDVKDASSTVMLFEVAKTGSNLSEPYKPQPFTSSPNLFGKQRGWYVCSVGGRTELVTRNGIRTDVNVNSGPGNE